MVKEAPKPRRQAPRTGPCARSVSLLHSADAQIAHLAKKGSHPKRESLNRVGLRILAVGRRSRVGRVDIGICGRIDRRAACRVNGVGPRSARAIERAVLRIGLTVL